MEISISNITNSAIIYFNEYHAQKNSQSSELEELPDYLEEKPSFDRKA